MAEGYWCVCPFCGLSRKIKKTGEYAKRYKAPIDPGKTLEKQEIRFDKLDPELAVFVDVRETGLGRGAGFPRLNHLCLSIKEAKNDMKYKNLIEQLKNQIKKISEILAD